MVSVTSSETDLRKLNLCNHLYLHSICFLYNIDVPFFQSRIGPYFTKRIKSSWKNALHSSLPECIGGGTCQKLTNKLRHPVILWWNVSVKKRKASPLQFWFFAVYTKKNWNSLLYYYVLFKNMTYVLYWSTTHTLAPVIIHI